jgi:cytochrome P450
MTPSILLPIILLITYFIYKHFIYPIFFSPLSRIPAAHFTSSFLPLWLLYNRRLGRETISVYQAHRKYGPIVRLAPDDISLCSLEGLRTVYVGGFERTQWFQQFANYNSTPNLVSLYGAKNHSNRKRMLSQIYSKSYILKSPDFHDLANVILFKRLLPFLVEQACLGEDVDMLKLGYVEGAEFVSAYEMGVQNSMNFLGDGREAERLRYIENSRKKIQGLPGKEAAIKELEVQCLDMCAKAEETMKNPKERSKPDSTWTWPVVYAQLKQSLITKESITNPKILQRVIASELLDNIEAGREGIGVIITYITHQLCKHPAVQAALHEELLQITPPLAPSRSHLLTETCYRSLDSLPLLEGVILETMRLYAHISNPQRRVVPPEGCVIEGYFLPGGTTVSSSAYCLHRHEGAYPAVNEWKPKRWIRAQENHDNFEADSGEDMTTRRNEDDPRSWFWAFGNGKKMCLGHNFSLLGG